MKTKLTLYENLKDTQGQIITLEDYILRVKSGPQTLTVMKAREHPHDSKEYEELKKTLPLVTGSAVMKLGEGKSAKAIDELNGLLFLDIDEGVNASQIAKIKADKHTLLLHETIGGAPRYTSVIRINASKFDESWLTASDYYYTNFGVSIDASCKNKNRLRFLSYDLNPYVNEKAHIFRAKSIKKFEPPKKNLTRYIFSQDDFGHIINQIQDRGINLAESYENYVQIGMALASEFASGGFQYFDAICQASTKYNYKRGKRDYEGFCANIDGRITIGTFYYLCKQENIQIYSERTIEIINSVKVGKAQGNPTVQSVDRHVKSLTGEELTDNERTLTGILIKSKEDYSSLANEDKTDIDILIDFIISMYNPYKCVISDNLYLEDGKYIDDEVINDIYIACASNLEGVKNVNIKEIRTVLNSSRIKHVNRLMDIINNYKDTNPTGYIQKYIDTIPVDSPEQREYNRWAFKRWIVGAVHNWTRHENNMLVSPLTLVLTGKTHGAGKTSFFEKILPEELITFFAESKLSDNKDSLKRMCINLILVDNEFSGDAVNDHGRFKSLVDMKVVTERFAYGYVDTRLPRRCTVGGTTNETDILRDETGNRRILPINVTSRIDYDALQAFPSELLITEAYNLLQDGFDWIVRSIEDMRYISKSCSQNLEQDPIEEIFFNFFKEEYESEYFVEVVMNQGEILNYLHNMTDLRPKQSELRRVYTRNNMEYKSHRIGDRVKQGYKLYCKHSEVIDAYRTDRQKADDIPF